MPNVRVPDDNRSIHDIGDFIMSYQPFQNAFINSLVNRIGRVLITSGLWSNPWAILKKGRLEYGETVEEIFANIAKPQSFNPQVAEKEVFKREVPDVRAAFHSMNYQKFYKVTISNDQLRQAFISFYELTELISRIVESMYSAANLDEYLTMKYLIAREALNGGIYIVSTPQITGTGADPAGVVKKFRLYTNDLTFLKSTYNRAHVRNSTPIDRQIIIIPNEAEATIGVDVLANAFHLSQVDYIGRRIAIDSFTFDTDDEARLAEIFKNDSTYVPFTPDEKASLESIVGAKVDLNWFMIFDNFEQFTENYNGQGLYWQYYYHVWKTFSVSPFANAIVFTTQESSITGVTINPSTSTVKPGSALTLTATVTGTGLIDKSVKWTISSDTDIASGTHIDGTNGVLYVARDQTAGSVITVTATTISGATGNSTVTVGNED